MKVDETFLTRKKYKGRICESNKVIFLRIHCQDDKNGLYFFFKLKGRKKCDLWQYIKHYYDPDASVICSDEAKQYRGVEIFKNAVHKTTNHSKRRVCSQI